MRARIEESQIEAFQIEALEIVSLEKKGYQIDSRHTNRSPLRPLLTLCLTLVLAGCGHWQAIAERDQLQQRLVQGDTFKHRLLWNEAAQIALTSPVTEPRTWHVYIEGDGHAVNLFGQPSADPTPPAPILLPALGEDQAPALYLGRPCYFDTQDDECNPTRWTLERYSAATVASLQAAVKAIVPQRDRLILIGHSGGGTLVMLLAPHLPQSCAVITLAGNLDVGAWIVRNDFTPLPDSLDPALQPPLSAKIRQWHFAGADDRVILPRWIEAVSAHQPNAQYVELANTDHITPWRRHLTESLKSLQNQQQSENVPAPLWTALDNSQSVCGKVTKSAPNKGL